MSALYGAVGLLAAGLFVYLLYAMLRAEVF